MLAQLMLTIDVPGWTVAQLQKAVQDIDEADSGEGNEIHAENVDVKDIFTLMFEGHLGVTHIIVDQAMTDD